MTPPAPSAARPAPRPDRGDFPTSAQFRLLLFLPILVCAYWFTSHYEYGRSDPSEYLWLSMRYYTTWQAEGFWSMLHGVYWDRIWKPLPHPALALPALALTGGNARFSAAITTTLAYGLFLLFSARLARIYLSRARALAVTWFVGLLPWVLKCAFVFGNEIFVLASSAAAAYYFFRDDVFELKGNGVPLGISLGMSFLFQPFVALAGVGSSFFVLACRAALLRKLHPDNLVYALPVPFLFGAIYLLQEMGEDSRGVRTFSLFLAAAFLPAWGVLWKKRLGPKVLSAPFYQAVLSAGALVAAWYAPFVLRAAAWSVECTSATAAYFVSVLTQDGFEFYAKIFENFGGPFLLFILLLCFGGAAAGRRSGPWSFGALGPWFFFPAAAVPSLIGVISFNQEVRYYFFGFTGLYFLGGVNAFLFFDGRGRVFRYAFAAGALCSVLLTLSSVFSFARLLPPWTGRVMTYMQVWYSHDPGRGADPAVPLAVKVAGLIDPDASARIAVLTSDIWVPDANVLWTIAMERGWKTEYWGASSFVGNSMRAEESIQAIRAGYDYLLVDMDRRGFENPLFSQAYERVQFHRKRGRLADIGLTPAGEFSIGPSHFFLLKTDRAPSS